MDRIIFSGCMRSISPRARRNPEAQQQFRPTFPNLNGQKTTFDPKQYKERVGLLLMNGVIYTGWASHCDINPTRDGSWDTASPRCNRSAR